MDESIKNRCMKRFKDHKATVVLENEDFLILDWRDKSGSGEYAVRYIVDCQKGNLIVSGIGEARVRNLEGAYAAEAGKEERLTLDNLGNLRAFTVEMEEGKLELDPARAHLAEIRELEGRKVLAVPLHGNVEVNGIRIDIGGPQGQE